MRYIIDIPDLPDKLQELRHNIESQRYAETVSSAEMYQARSLKNVDDIETAIIEMKE